MTWTSHLVDLTLVHFCCETCALCQEYRELKNCGFDMGIGMTYSFLVNHICISFSFPYFVLIISKLCGEENPFFFSLMKD
jgi:hypothetical protein